MAKKKAVEAAPKAVQGQQVFSTLESPTLTKNIQTSDSFRNFAMRIGVANRGEVEQGQAQNVISDGTYRFNLITRNRILLEAAYRGSWIVGRVCDCVAEDMTREGIVINTNDGADKISELMVQFSRLQVYQAYRDSIAWGRLYGGAIGIFQIDGQDLQTPLDPDTIGEGQFRGIAVYDRWQLNPVLSQVIEEGPDIGLPAYYDIVLGNNLNEPAQVPGAGSQYNAGQSAEGGPDSVKMTGQTAGGPSSYGRVRVHYSRVFRMGGHKLPFFQAITEMMWDESVIERMWDRLVEFETATAATGALIGRANLRTVGIKGFRQIISQGGKAYDALIQSFDLIRQMQTSESITLLDSEDEFQSIAYSFAGISEVIERFGEQLSGASETPLVRLFGQSPGGLNSSGDADMRNYYDSIKAKQESKLRNPIEMTLKIMWRSCFGEAAPKDLEFTFAPLWQMSATDKADIMQKNVQSIALAHDSGLTSTSTAMKELKESSADSGIFTHITDEEIEEAENELPPMPDVENDPHEPASPSSGVGDPGGNPVAPPEKAIGEKKISPIGGSDSIWKRIFRRKAKDVKPKQRVKTADQKAIEKWLKKKL